MVHADNIYLYPDSELVQTGFSYDLRIFSNITMMNFITVDFRKFDSWIDEKNPNGGYFF